ncbi:hypothetical protein M406DRAFT_333693 [Cryphonectria parasitica EP155]|uniref:Uncharacterized protein n=1 Tax=Cryphonectria parasitica (strain ATCC 38755 / EP155) TaxID=660469 RepID=A0A9P5CL42_CRYP1|nr:uncharacterized protein M406DRAFT_333693 [Cryphonectria parasitica EP155]KAF3761631.1 hypothetical protein M406DRAFT_333693 [Cryphonectria parasitica EP155]
MPEVSIVEQSLLKLAGLSVAAAMRYESVRGTYLFLGQATPNDERCSRNTPRNPRSLIINLWCHLPIASDVESEDFLQTLRKQIAKTRNDMDRRRCRVEWNNLLGHIGVVVPKKFLRPENFNVVMPTRAMVCIAPKNLSYEIGSTRSEIKRSYVNSLSQAMNTPRRPGSVEEGSGATAAYHDLSYHYRAVHRFNKFLHFQEIQVKWKGEPQVDMEGLAGKEIWTIADRASMRIYYLRLQQIQRIIDA